VAIYTTTRRRRRVRLASSSRGLRRWTTRSPVFRRARTFFRCDVHPATMVGTVGVTNDVWDRLVAWSPCTAPCPARRSLLTACPGRTAQHHGGPGGLGSTARPGETSRAADLDRRRGQVP
jgi:hypothetical protein